MAQPSTKSPALALLAGIAGWLLPGTGHLLLRQWGRSLAVFLTVGALAATGVALRGRLFTLATSDFFDLLGFFADCGAGVFFYLARQVENGGPDVSRAAGDYGTRFFAAAGVLNLLAAVDAYHLASGGRHEDYEEEPAADGNAAASAGGAPAETAAGDTPSPGEPV